MSRYVRLSVAVFLIFNIILAITVITLVSTSHRLRHYEPQQKSERQSAVLKQRLDEIYETVRKGFATPASIPGEEIKESPSLEFLSLLKPVSQLSGLDFDDNYKAKRRTTEFEVLRNWADNEGAERNLLWNGMTYENGSFSVPVNGVYHVHSHVKFYVENNKADDSSKQFQHKLLRYSASTGLQELVALNVVSECKEGINDGAHLEYPSDLDSLVHLNAGDQLTIKVTESNLLRHDRDWHNFGTYLI